LPPPRVSACPRVPLGPPPCTMATSLTASRACRRAHATRSSRSSTLTERGLRVVCVEAAVCVCGSPVQAFGRLLRRCLVMLSSLLLSLDTRLWSSCTAWMGIEASRATAASDVSSSSCYRVGGTDGALTPTRYRPSFTPRRSGAREESAPQTLLWSCAHVRVPWIRAGGRQRDVAVTLNPNALPRSALRLARAEV
jgi:hypothetical protein